MFPLSIRGSIYRTTERPINVDRVREKICRDLQAQKINYTVQEDRIEFRNWGLVWSWSRYAAVDWGSFNIRSDRIEYCLSTKFLFIVCTFAAVAVGLLVSPSEGSIFMRSALIFSGWLYFYGINSVLLTLRNQRFLRELTKEGE